MSRLVVGTDGPVARALGDAPPVTAAEAIAAAMAAPGSDELVLVALPAPAGPAGALPTEELADLLDRTLTPALAAARLAAQAGRPLRIVGVCPAGALLPDHDDGARAVAGAGLAMLIEIASAVDGLTANLVAVAEEVPAQAVAEAVAFALAQPALNGATIRLDGGRDAVLDVETRAEGE